jgi:hypothetical protein
VRLPSFFSFFFFFYSFYFLFILLFSFLFVWKKGKGQGREGKECTSTTWLLRFFSALMNLLRYFLRGFLVSFFRDGVKPLFFSIFHVICSAQEEGGKKRTE